MSEHTIVIDENLSTNLEFIFDDASSSSARNFSQKRTFSVDIHSRKTMRKIVNINNNKTSQKISQKISKKISKKISQKTFSIFKRSVNFCVKIFSNAFKTFNKFEFYVILKISTNTQINCLNDDEFNMYYIQSSDDDDI